MIRAGLTQRPFGEQVRQRRLQVELTQLELAERAGMSVRALRDIELGKVRRPRTRALQQLAAALDLPVPVRGPVLALHPPPPGRGGPLQIRVLGPLTLRHGPVPVEIPQRKIRSLLGLLAIQPGKLVTRDEMVDMLWGERPPSSYRDLVHRYVGWLRRLLGPDPPDSAPVLRTSHGGYQLDLPADQLDVRRFAEMVERAEVVRAGGEPEAAWELFARAIAEWDGPVLADLEPHLRHHPAATAVAQRRLTTAAAWADLALELIRPEPVIAPLWVLVREEPLHEGLHARLMLLLASCGQQAAALEVFADLRQRLVDELGVEPGAEVKNAYVRILRQELPGIARAEVAHSEDRDAEPPGTACLPRPACQLPFDAQSFTGREGQLAELDQMLAPARPGTAAIALVTGPAGAGKTALAVHWAHLVREEFQGGTLFANLRGFDPAGVPALPGDVLDMFLRAVGVPPETIPATTEGRAALFQARVDGERMLIVLDNAANADQVRWLLPEASSCLVVVTSRSQLSGLVLRSGARRVGVGVLSEGEATELLRQVCGASRVDSERDAAADLARLCARLPLALGLVGERANARPYMRLSDLAAELTDEYRRLDMLAVADDESAAVRAAFSWSYRALPPEAARIFRLLGLHPGPEMPLGAVAALAGATIPYVWRQLDVLVSLHLVDEVARDRCRIHDLLFAYASECARADEPPAGRDEALRRMLEWYLYTADAVDRALMPARRRVPLGQDARVPTEGFGSPAAALAWCEAERDNLVSAVSRAYATGNWDVAWQLPLALWSYFTVRKRWSDWIITHELGLVAVRRHSDRGGEALVLGSLANAYRDVRRFDEAFAHARQAVAVSREIGEPWVEAATMLVCGIAHRDLGQLDRALACCQRSLKTFESISDAWGTAWALFSLSEIYIDLRRCQDAAEHGQRALDRFVDIGDEWGRGAILLVLARSHLYLDRYPMAAEWCRRALVVAREIGNRQGEALALYILGKVQHGTGQPGAARRSWQRSLAMLDELGAPLASRVRARLARLERKGTGQ